MLENIGLPHLTRSTANGYLNLYLERPEILYLFKRNIRYLYNVHFATHY